MLSVSWEVDSAVERRATEGPFNRRMLCVILRYAGGLVSRFASCVSVKVGLMPICGVVTHNTTTEHRDGCRVCTASTWVGRCILSFQSRIVHKSGHSSCLEPQLPVPRFKVVFRNVAVIGFLLSHCLLLALSRISNWL